jgi:hypothetical protein
MVTKLLEAPIIQHWSQNHVNLCFAEIWSTILPLEQIGIKWNKENRTLKISPIKNKKGKSQIPYEYKVEDQVLLETPGILRKLSTPRTGPYPVTNVYKNGTIRFQKDKKELHQKDWISVELLHSIKSPIKYILGAKWHTIEYELKR